MTINLVRYKFAAIIAVMVIGIAGFTDVLSRYGRVSASATGPTPSHTNAPGEANCTACHTSFPIDTGGGNIQILDVPSTYRPGQQIAVRVRVNHASAVLYGFQMTAIDSFGRPAGTYTLPPTVPQRLQLMNGVVNSIERTYISHTVDGIIPTQFDFNEWSFTWTAPSQNVGKVTFYATGNGADSDGTPAGDYIYSATKIVYPRAAVPRFDFDGDALTDIGIYRPAPAEWWYLRSLDGEAWATQFGAQGDIPVPVDFTGDSRSDIAFFRPATGQWFVLRSEDFSFYSFPFGSNGDVPMPADYDNDGKTDAAVYRPSNSLWVILRSSDGQAQFTQFGTTGDLPVAADYDGDGSADVGIFRPSGGSGSGEWWIQRSAAGLLAVVFGTSGDKAVPGDYTGDGKADVAVWRPSNGNWFILRSEDFSFFAFPWGAPGDQPAPGDYDGDGKTDAAVFRQPVALWFALRSTSGPMTVGFGSAGDQPLPGSFVR